MLLDGQQRLTSLATVLKGKSIRVKRGNKEREVPIEIYFNLDHPENIVDEDSIDIDEENGNGESTTEEIDDVDEVSNEQEIDDKESRQIFFQLRSKKIENKANWIPVTKLFIEGVGSIIQDKGINPTEPNYGKYLDRLNTLYSRKDNYFYPVQILRKDKSYREVTEVFVRVNSSGMKLRSSDLALAQVTSRWPGSMTLFSDFVKECQSSNYDLDEGFLIKSLVSVSTWQNRFRIIDRIPITKMKDDWEKTKKGIELTINFLKENAKIETSEILPSPFLLIPIIVVAVKSGYKFTTEQERGLLRWFYAAAMWGRYSRGATETALDEDLQVIKTSDSPIEGLIKNIVAASGRLEVTPDDLAGKNRKSAFFVMSYVLTRRNNAKDWGTGLIFSLRSIGKDFKNEYDHIFPSSKLLPYLSQKYPNDKQKVKRLLNDLANIAFLSKRHNLIKGNKLPQEYFRTIIAERGSEALTAQHITLEEDLWSLERYEDFLRERRRHIATGINELMNVLEKGEKVQDKSDARVEPRIEDIIKDGESYYLELKSSMIWNYKTQLSDKALVHSILKNISAFMNSEGGTIIVGVSDDLEILGLEKDFKSLGEKKNWDVWNRHLVNMINTYIGKEFHQFISIDPIKQDSKIVALLRIKKGSRESYIEDSQKKSSEFFIRAGTTVQPLNTRQASEYIKDHWHSGHL